MFRSILPLGFGLLVCVGFVGCRQEAPVEFEPNMVHAMKYQIQEGIPMDQASKDTTWVVTKMFGTPNQPKVPDFVHEDEDLDALVSEQRLMRASGPLDEDGRGLYRKHCALCHGVTGNGRGTTAAILNPYPRDYRMGIFKFKSTPRGSKPTREDVSRSIRNGIAGTAMNKIPELSEEDVQSLVDYVIYLSWRGELERALIDDAIFELDLEAGDRIISPELANSEKEEDKELFAEQWEIATDFAAEIADSWLEAEDEVIEVPAPPADLPVPNSRKEFVEMLASSQGDALKASVESGQKLFVGKIASCSKCHGEQGLGNGQTTDYDDWTKDWTTRIGLKPEERETLVPLLARGALPPINAVPRNFAEGIFHGGADSEDLYRRITQGIDGTPMPAATFVEGEFEQGDVWHLINFIRSLQTTDHDPSSDPEVQQVL
ncbi:cytochrome c [Novipirellula artificiosorum]|uniref:Cytochrome c n=1 Tax=Novipirellula artificiosorum TaxID=2528016 RepID=A0A5C6DER8_9BACT|nr:c-type cytochrome [Novipirellula artificiosorum]TWU34241.1 Cytochrome c [Novipirellula artificiosorum]